MDPICLQIEEIAGIQHAGGFTAKPAPTNVTRPASLAAMSPLEAIAMHRGHLPPQIEAADGQHGLPFDT